MTILVSGRPSSGNHLIRAHIQRCIRARRPYVNEEVIIHHGTDAIPQIKSLETTRAVVIPVRNERCRLASERRRWSEPPSDEYAMRHVMRLIVERELPFKLVSYEALVQEPDHIGKLLIEWLDLPWVDWPVEDVVDDRRQWQGRVVNGNLRYSLPVEEQVDVCITTHTITDPLEWGAVNPVSGGCVQM